MLGGDPGHDHLAVSDPHARAVVWIGARVEGATAAAPGRSPAGKRAPSATARVASASSASESCRASATEAAITPLRSTDAAGTPLGVTRAGIVGRAPHGDTHAGTKPGREKSSSAGAAVKAHISVGASTCAVVAAHAGHGSTRASATCTNAAVKSGQEEATGTGMRSAASAASDDHRVSVDGDHKAASAPGSAALFGGDATNFDAVQATDADQNFEDLAFVHSEVAFHAGALTAENGSQTASASLGAEDFNGQTGHARRHCKVDDSSTCFDRLRTGAAKTCIGKGRVSIHTRRVIGIGLAGRPVRYRVAAIGSWQQTNIAYALHVAGTRARFGASETLLIGGRKARAPQH